LSILSTSSSDKPHDGGAFEAQSRWNLDLLIHHEHNPQRLPLAVTITTHLHSLQITKINLLQKQMYTVKYSTKKNSGASKNKQVESKQKNTKIQNNT